MDTTVKKDGTYCESGLAYAVIGDIIKLSHASISARKTTVEQEINAVLKTLIEFLFIWSFILKI